MYIPIKDSSVKTEDYNFDIFVAKWLSLFSNEVYFYEKPPEKAVSEGGEEDALIGAGDLQYLDVSRLSFKLEKSSFIYFKIFWDFVKYYCKFLLLKSSLKIFKPFPQNNKISLQTL